MNYLYVMIGGALGALCRYGVGQWLSGIRLFRMPVGTLAVNLLGCLLLGWLTGVASRHATLPYLSEEQSRMLLLMLSTGFCGAFTTFSTFSKETIEAMESGLVWQALLYLLLSVGLGFLLFWWAKNV